MAIVSATSHHSPSRLFSHHRQHLEKKPFSSSSLVSLSSPRRFQSYESPRLACGDGQSADKSPGLEKSCSGIRNNSGFFPRFLQMDAERTCSDRTLMVKSASAESGGTSTISQKAFGVLHLVVSLGIILAMDKFLKKAFVAAAIKFPSALFGMFCIFSVLMILDSTVPAAATGLMSFFQPALLFIQRWLPLFYVPLLVVLPLAVKSIPAASGFKICLILGTTHFDHRVLCVLPHYGCLCCDYLVKSVDV